GHLDKTLPARGKVRAVEHPSRPAHSEIPRFMADLRSRTSISARALEFLVLTAARTSAVIGARLDEVDFNGGIWTVPPERLGAKIYGDKPRRVPLCERAIEILEARPREEGNPHLFAGGKRGAGLSNMAMSELLDGMR